MYSPKLILPLFFILCFLPSRSGAWDSDPESEMSVSTLLLFWYSTRSLSPLNKMLIEISIHGHLWNILSFNTPLLNQTCVLTSTTTLCCPLARRLKAHAPTGNLSAKL